MISSLEVGGVFRLVDEASPQLIKIADALKDLQVQIDKTKDSFKLLADSTFGGLTGRIDKLAGSLEKVQGASGEIAGNLDRAMTTVAGSITAVGDSIGGLTAKINALNAELAATTSSAARTAKRAAAESDAGRLLGGPIGSGGPLPTGGTGGGAPTSIANRQGNRGWLHAQGRASLPGGHIGLAGPGGLAEMAAGLAAGWGIDDEMKVEDQAAMSAYISGDKWAKENAADAIKQYRDIATSAALKGSANPIDIATAMHRGANLLSGQMDYRRMLGLEQAVLPYAIGEARAKGISVEESMTSMVEGVHQAGIYDPAGVEKFMRDFQFAGAVTPVSMPTFVRALGYSQAQLRTLGVSDSETAILATAALQRGGVTNTRSGTWIRDYYQRLLPDRQVDKNGQMKDHDQALLDMGLIDKDYNIQWHAQNKDGSEDYKTELLNQSSIINRFADAQKARGDIGKELLNSDLHYAFGQQGGSFASFLGDDAFRKQIGNLSASNKGFEGGDAMLDWMRKNDPLFQAQEVWRDFQKTMMDLGQNLMPAVLTTLKSIDGVLHVLDPVLSGLAKVIGVVVGTPTAPPKGGGGSLNPFKNGFIPPWLGGEATPQSWDGSTAGLLHKIGYIDGGSLNDGVYRNGGGGGDGLSGGIANAQTVDILASVVNLASMDGGYPGKSGFMSAAYTPDDDAGGAGDYGGGLHSGGGYTVLGGGHGSSILRARGHYSDGASLAYSGGSAGMDQRGLQLMGYLVGQGWTPEAASIAAGNAQQESSIRSDGAAGDGGISHGMFQWNKERYAGLLAYARSHGLDPSSLAAQEGFFAAEAEAKVPGWKHAADLSAAGLISHAYEGYGDNSTGTRIANSKHFLALWKDHAATTPTVAADYPDHGFHSGTVHAASLNAASSSGGEHAVHVHTAVNLDGKHLTSVIHKHTVRRNRQVFGASQHDVLGNLSPVDGGFQFER
jgi:hypothetical protein